MSKCPTVSLDNPGSAASVPKSVQGRLVIDFYNKSTSHSDICPSQSPVTHVLTIHVQSILFEFWNILNLTLGWFLSSLWLVFVIMCEKSLCCLSALKGIDFSDWPVCMCLKAIDVHHSLGGFSLHLDVNMLFVCTRAEIENKIACYKVVASLLFLPNWLCVCSHVGICQMMQHIHWLLLWGTLHVWMWNWLLLSK